jgi:hypothetical protein
VALSALWRIVGPLAAPRPLPTLLRPARGGVQAGSRLSGAHQGEVTIAITQSITPERFAELTRPLVGLPVSHSWRGYGSAIFLELGALKSAGPGRERRGDVSVMLQWSWRVESIRAIRFGSWSGERRITNGVRALTGRRVVDVGVTGRLPELVLSLDGGLWVHSFMTAEGQPEWTVFLPDGSWLHVVRGRLTHDTQNVRRRRSRT